MAEQKVRLLPTEVELAIELQPCLAERRTYERADEKHPCEFFSDQGSFHAYDLRKPGPPEAPGTLQQVEYAGRRRVVPEMLSGCRKAPIMAVGINPNLPTFWEAKRSSILPMFDDVLQYAHHYRYRGVGKLQIKESQYEELLGKREDDPARGPELTRIGRSLQVELSDQSMYLAYESLLDGLAQAMGWNAKLTVSEDLSYGNMVACGSPRWIVRPDPKAPHLPVMTTEQRTGIVEECFVRRRYFLRQLFQSLPRVLLVFSAATRDPFITAMGGNFVAGNPRVGEDIEALLARKIVLRFGKTPSGDELRARVLFVPHASGNPAQFKEVRQKVVAALVEEAKAGHLTLDTKTGRLRRPLGDCSFCDNALYRIGPCDYREELVPLTKSVEEGAEEGSPTPRAVLENRAQQKLLDAFLEPKRAIDEGSIEEGAEEAGEAGRYVLHGRVVTMNASFKVIPDGAVYVNDGVIEAVRRASDGKPDGYDDAPVLETGGTIYPGLIDLHNHLAYNVLPPWGVSKRYDDRSQWRRAKDYAARVGIMRVLKTGDAARAVARYVEVKALLGGVTTAQGLRSSFASVSAAMRGIVRNVESPGAGLPSGGSSVQDLDIGNRTAVERFREAVNHETRAYFYHLSEGINDAARQFWRDLDESDLLGPGLVGIHCLAVPRAGFKKLRQNGSTVVWSPTSNMMLYGSTLQLKPLLDSGVNWALGCDWSPTGGKNPLFELKVARLVAEEQGVSLRARDLVAAVTTRAAAGVRWTDSVGQIADDFRADLIVLAGDVADPYEQLVAATESDIRLVMIDGVIRAGSKKLFDAGGVPENGRESVAVGGRAQLLWLRDANSPLDGFKLDRAVKLVTDRMKKPDDYVEEAVEEGAFELELDDEMAPLPPLPGADDGIEEAVEIVAQTPDAFTVTKDAPLFQALRAIEHFPLDVDRLEDFYR